ARGVRGDRVGRGRGRRGGGRGGLDGDRGAFGDGQFGLFEDGGGDAELLVEDFGDQWHAAGSADEEDPGELLGAPAGEADDALGLADGAGEQGAGKLVEFASSEVEGLFEVGDGHGGHGGAREHLLGAADVVPEGAAVAQLGGGGGAFEAFPQFGFALSDGLADVGDERGVDVEAAEVAQAAVGEDAEGAVGSAFDDGDVEGAAAEVEDGEGLAGADGVVEARGVVVGGGDRFGDELDGGVSGSGGGVVEGGAALLAPGGGAGHDGAGEAA